MAASDHLQGQLFSTSSMVSTPRENWDPEAWSKRADIVHHSSFEQNMPQDSKTNTYGPGFHAGTFAAAEYRGQSRPFVHPLRLTGGTALDLKSEYHYGNHPLTYSDGEANNLQGTLQVKQGLNVPYVNEVESPGSISFRSPRENLKTWSEDVQSDPGAGRFHKLLAEQFDVSIPLRKNMAAEYRHWSNGMTQQQLPGTQDFRDPSVGTVPVARDRIELMKKRDQ